MQRRENGHGENKASVRAAATSQAPNCDRVNLRQYGDRRHDNGAKSPPEQFIKSSRRWNRVHAVYCILPLTYVEMDDKSDTANLSVCRLIHHMYCRRDPHTHTHCGGDNDAL